MIETSMRQYLGENPRLKYVFFGGKGGVGKTVLAGTAALWMAGQGKKTLLASTNPVHSLSSMLDQNVFGKPVAVTGVPNLLAYETDILDYADIFAGSHVIEAKVGEKVPATLKLDAMPASPSVPSANAGRISTCSFTAA